SGGSGMDAANCPRSSKSSGDGTLTVQATCQDLAGNTGNATQAVKVDKTAPVTTLTPGPGAAGPGLPLVSGPRTATVKNLSGTVLGTLPVSCWDSQGLKLGMAATDSGSGVAGLTYAAAGAQPIASTTVNGASTQLAISSHGRTALTYAASDVAGNIEA